VFFNALTQGGVAAARLVKKSGTFGSRQLKRRVENLNFAFRWLMHGQFQSFTLQCEINSQKRQGKLSFQNRLGITQEAF
jgi:hypothetical protein